MRVIPHVPAAALVRSPYSVRKMYGAITVCKCTVTSTFSPMRTVSDTDFIRTHAGSWLFMAHGTWGMLYSTRGALGCRKRNFRGGTVTRPLNAHHPISLFVVDPWL